MGCGNIGFVIAKAVDSGVIKGRLVSVYDVDYAKAEKLASRMKKKPSIASLSPAC
jgi:predicted dinucleotide-utilizing enzyme